MDNNLHRRIIGTTWLYVLVVSIIISIIFRNDMRSYTVGFILGSFTGLLNYTIIIKFIGNMNFNKNVAAKAFSNYIFRLIIYGVVFYLALSSGFNILTTVFGFISVKIGIVLDAHIQRRRYN